MSRNNIPIPFFPVPPEEYSRRYLSEVTRSFSLYAGQLQSALGGDARSGVVTLDFTDNSNVATASVTGLNLIQATDVVMVSLRIEATDDHTVEDLLIDPIRVAVSAIVSGSGFTVYGTMENAVAHGAYKINWHVASK